MRSFLISCVLVVCSDLCWDFVHRPIEPVENEFPFTTYAFAWFNLHRTDMSSYRPIVEDDGQWGAFLRSARRGLILPCFKIGQVVDMFETFIMFKALLRYKSRALNNITKNIFYCLYECVGGKVDKNWKHHFWSFICAVFHQHCLLSRSNFIFLFKRITFVNSHKITLIWVVYRIPSYFQHLYFNTMKDAL